MDGQFDPENPKSQVNVYIYIDNPKSAAGELIIASQYLSPVTKSYKF
jgi:hypothetical protein